MPKIEEDEKSWLRRPTLYKGVVELYKKKMEILEAEILCLQLVIVMIVVREVLSSRLLYKFNRADRRS